jgi:hypothetical protein
MTRPCVALEQIKIVRTCASTSLTLNFYSPRKQSQNTSLRRETRAKRYRHALTIRDAARGLAATVVVEISAVLDSDVDPTSYSLVTYRGASESFI